MANLADFVGTWYFRGSTNFPCYIRLETYQGQERVRVDDGHGGTWIGHIEGYDELVPDVTTTPYPGNLRGVLSSDARRIAWNNGESWLR